MKVYKIDIEDIVLKSEGTQFFSYTYVADAVTAILYILFNGENGEAYNVSDSSYDITLRDLANTIAKQVGRKVIFDLPSEEERKGYSTATKAIMNSSKLKEIGWNVTKPLDEALNRTINILKEI